MRSTSAMETVNLKAEVKEEKGEISMSVQETNRVRALLGLRPLAINKEGGTAEEKVKDVREENAHKREQSEITGRIERARMNRKRKEKLAGPIALSAVQDGEDDVLSAESWVKSSKKRMTAAAQQRDVAERNRNSRAAAISSESYQESDLKGLAVLHDADKFEAGKEVVLTLQDDEILERDVHGVARSVAEGRDKLENVKFSEDDRRLNAEQRTKRAKKGTYVGYDDDEFMADAEIGPGAKRAILSHYDEDVENGKFHDKGIIIGDTSKQEATTFAANRPKFDADVMSKALGGGGLISASEYYTEEEMATFKKPKKMRNKKLSRRKREEATVEEASEDGVVRGGTAAALEASLASAGKTGSKVDHGSRNGRDTSLPDTEEIKKARFESAIAKASDAASKVLMPPSSKPKPEEEEERQVKLQLARSRQIAERAASEEGHNKTDVGERVAARVLSTVKTEPVSSELNNSMNNNGGQTEGGGVVFTSTTEFTSRLAAVLTERARDRDLSKQREVARAEREAAEQLEKELEAQREMDVKEEPTAAINATTDAENGNEHGLEYMHRQPLARSSLAAAMNLLQQSGDLGRSNIEERTGRAKDKAVGTSHEGVKLEYRDEYGRALTQKEAFRQMNYRFHGFGPGKKKQEKRIKKLKEEYERTKARERGEFAVQNQERMQEAMNQAYVVVSGSKGTGLSGEAGSSILDLKKAKAKKRKESSSTKSSRKRG